MIRSQRKPNTQKILSCGKLSLPKSQEFSTPLLNDDSQHAQKRDNTK